MKPVYKNASATGEYVCLKNELTELRFFRRISGWGFGELYSPEGELLGVLEHLGELRVRDCEIPMRLEGDTYEYSCKNGVATLTFNVSTTMARKMLHNTSFDGWIRYPFSEEILTGTVTFTLRDGCSVINMHSSLEARCNVYFTYLRTLWLLVGEGSFGARKDDAILPGVDFALGREWTSGCDFFRDPWANRCIPHKNKVTAPVMAISHGGRGVGVSFDFREPVSRWFNYGEYYPQPVFAAPNFLQRADNSLLGLMIPDVKRESDENRAEQEAAELHIGQRIELSAQIFTVCGNSIDVLTDYVKRTGLPEYKKPRYTPDECLELIARTYDERLWHEGEGFGLKQRDTDTASPDVPAAVRRFAVENPDLPVSRSLARKIAWCDEKRGAKKPGDIIAHGDELLSYQRRDGAFCFEPDGRHSSKDDFRVARAFIAPMGCDGDTALHMCTQPAYELMRIYEKTGEERYAAGAKKALDFCLCMTRPEGGDYWETPLHAPNLLAAGGAANAYYHAYRLFGDERYLKKGIYFLRTLLVFTQLWEARDVQSLYNTKPCLCASDWYFANWVRDFVQWEVLSCFAQAADDNIDWAKIDRELDWDKYLRGITYAAMNWMVNGDDGRWRPHNLPDSYDKYRAGEFDGCFADTFNSVTGNLGGMCIPPAPIASLLYELKKKD